jgi:hypothetical protein
MIEADHSIPDHYGIVVEILEYDIESCFICGALVYRRNSVQHESWHRRLEGEDVAPV